MAGGERNYEAEARELGWRPLSDFKGDPEKFVDAQEYVEKGETLMPILKANNRKLMGEITSVKGQLSETNKLLQQSQQQIAELLEVNTAAKQREAKDTKKDLITAIETARAAGETQRVVELSLQLDEHTAAIAKAAEKPVVKKEEPAKRTDEMTAADKAIWDGWVADNPWWEKDEDRTTLAMAQASKLRQKGSTLKGREFFDKVSEEVERLLPSGGARNGAGKVEEGRPSGGGGGGGGAGKDYANLPSDVRAKCDEMMGRLKTQPGQPGSIFKDAKAYRAHYAKVYFTEDNV
jgi:hypothetical protein